MTSFMNRPIMSECFQDSPTDRYEGMWKDGKYWGKGIYFWKDGQKLEGTFENGLGVGYAVYTYKVNILNRNYFGKGV